MQRGLGQAFLDLHGLGDVASDAQDLDDGAGFVSGERGDPPGQPTVVTGRVADPVANLQDGAVGQILRGEVRGPQPVGVLGVHQGLDIPITEVTDLLFGEAEQLSEIAGGPNEAVAAARVGDVDPVGAGGQYRVVEGGAFAQPGLGLTFPGDVGERCDRAQQPAVAVPDLPGGDQHIVQRLAHRTQLKWQVHQIFAGQRPAKGGALGWQLGAIGLQDDDAGGDLVTADALAVGNARQPTLRGVSQDDRAVGVAGQDAGVDGLEDGVTELFAFGQRLQRLPQVALTLVEDGDVMHRHNGADHLPVHAAQGVPGHQHGRGGETGRVDDDLCVADAALAKGPHQRDPVRDQWGRAVGLVQVVAARHLVRIELDVDVEAVHGAGGGVEHRQPAGGVAGHDPDVEGVQQRVGEALSVGELGVRVDQGLLGGGLLADIHDHAHVALCSARPVAHNPGADEDRQHGAVFTAIVALGGVAVAASGQRGELPGLPGPVVGVDQCRGWLTDELLRPVAEHRAKVWVHRDQRPIR